MEDSVKVIKQNSSANPVGSTPKVEELDENTLVRVKGGISTDFTRKERLPNSPATISNSHDTAIGSS